jgi:hypothetical protein
VHRGQLRNKPTASSCTDNKADRDPGFFLNPEIPGLDGSNPGISGIGIDNLVLFYLMITVLSSILAAANYT